MSDVMKGAHSTEIDIKNGSIIVSTPATGKVEKRDPDLNKFTPSGTFISRLDTRLDEHYGGLASGLP